MDMASHPTNGIEGLECPRPYHYHALDSTSDDIRLFVIPRKAPGSITSVNYALTHTSLRKACKFIALSYCWGDGALSHEIQINGGSMRITESLATALASLQSEDQDLVLWADAICINQDDSIEKTSQVQLMRDIYRTAHQVTIWLGPSNAETYYTIREMRKLGNILLDAGFGDLSAEDILHWEVQDDDASSSASTKRAILEIESGHLSKMRNDEFPFWWMTSDLGKRDWFHVSIESNVKCLSILTVVESLVYPGVH
jgi:hypothetical protein